MTVRTLLVVGVLCCAQSSVHAQLRGDRQALALVDRMLETLGGKEVWKNGRTIHVVLEGHYAMEAEPWNEEFWIDLEDPRGRYEITSGSSPRVIGWTRAGGWEQKGTVVEPYSKDRLDMEIKYYVREPNVVFHRLARGMPSTRVGLDSTDSHLAKLIVIDASASDTLCWFALNPQGEPVKWSTKFNNNLFEHILGPLKKYGNVSLPKWGGTIGGVWRYEHLFIGLSPDAPRVSFEPNPTR